MKKLKATLLLLISLLLPLPATAGLSVDPSVCEVLGFIQRDYTVLHASKTTQEGWDAGFDPEWLKTAPEELKTLFARMKEVAVKLNNTLSPEENLLGMTNFCLQRQGDVEKMIKDLEIWLEYDKKI